MTYKLLPKSGIQIHDDFSFQLETISRELPPQEFLKEAIFAAESHHQKYYLQRNHIRLCESLNLRSAEQFADSHLACKLNGYV
ncbi:hypothetical protein COCNU_03G008750 [Cocos nucifera]|uniref:Uncharacterized protein n=1 Tax=Cocos nucifera TaxID=13894 RepID=A0A8K0I3A7_COCNU|nr:hypothetical protein COCNU_03G008750 [Cocos nucifera]